MFGLDPAVGPSCVELLRKIAWVFEDNVLTGALAARKLFELNRDLYRDTRSDSFVRRLCECLEVPLDKLSTKLSLGTKTESALVAAMAQRLRLLILDKSIRGLDHAVLDELVRIQVGDCTADGWAIFLSTHQLPKIEPTTGFIGNLESRQATVAVTLFIL